jgi:hypothetical protein
LQDRRHDNKEKSPIVLNIALVSNIAELELKSPIAINALLHVKCVWSSSALLGPVSSSGQTILSPKRVCQINEANETNSIEDMMIPELILGSATDNQDQGIGLSLQMYEYSYETNPITSPSDDDSEEQDRQLGEELKEAGSESSDHDSSFDSALLATSGGAWGRRGQNLWVALQHCSWCCNDRRIRFVVSSVSQVFAANMVARRGRMIDDPEGCRVVTRTYCRQGLPLIIYADPDAASHFGSRRGSVSAASNAMVGDMPVCCRATAVFEQLGMIKKGCWPCE